MASLGLSAFLSGAAKTGLSTWEQREKDKREIEKVKLLEQLRRSTSDYEFNRALEVKRQSTDRFQSGIDGEEYVMRNEFGEEVGRRAPTTSERAEVESKALDQSYKKAQIDNIATDNSFRERQLGLQAEGLNLERARMNKSDREDREEGRDALWTDFNKTYTRLKDAGLNDYQLLGFANQWQQGIEDGWDKARQKRYIRIMSQKAEENLKKQNLILGSGDSSTR